MDWLTAKQHTTKTSENSFMGLKTYHYDTETSCKIDVVLGLDKISLYVWEDGNLIDSAFAFTLRDYMTAFAQFVTLYGVPLFI